MNDEQANEINDVAPTSLSHLIGQKGVIEQVKIGIEAAFADDKRFDSALLVGPPGVGKSALAMVLAQEMATEFHEVFGQSIKTNADLNGLLLSAKPKDIVHIDEVHELKKQLQTALYLGLDKGHIFVQGGQAKPQAIPIAEFSLLLSTTDENYVLQPLRDRMKLLLRFDFYGEEDLILLLRQRSRALRWSVDEEVLPLIAPRSRGTPRLALRLLQSARRVCRAEGANTITLAHLERSCQLEGINALGLGPTEQRYLEILGEGPTRLNVIASIIGLPPRTISQVTEPFLLRAGLLGKDDQGRRQLTAKGREHLSNRG